MSSSPEPSPPPDLVTDDVGPPGKNNAVSATTKSSSSDDEDEATTATSSTTTTSTTNRDGSHSQSRNLKDALEVQKENLEQGLPEEVLAIFQKKMNEYKNSPIFQYTLKVGDEFPDFSLPCNEATREEKEEPSTETKEEEESTTEDNNYNNNTTHQKYLSSVDLLAQHPYLVVIFFRGGWCRFCETTLEIWNRYMPLVKEKNAAFVAIAPQTLTKSLETQQKLNVQFPILTDEHCEFAQTLCVAYEVDELQKQYAPIIPAFNAGDDDWTIPIPATFVIRASDRKVIYCHYEIDFWDRAEPTEVLNSIPTTTNSTSNSEDGQQNLSKEGGLGATKGGATEDDDTTPLRNALAAELERLETIDLMGSSSMDDIKREIRALKDAGIGMGARKVGSKIPDFRLLEVECVDGSSSTNNMINVSNDCQICNAMKKPKYYDSKKLLKKKDGHLVIVFVHGDWSTFCQLTLQAWQDQYSKLQAKGANLIVISPGSKWDYSSTLGRGSGKNATITKKKKFGGYDFPILYDEGNSLCKQFRLRYQMDAKLPSQTNPWPLPITATYVVENATHEVIWSHVDSDHTARAEPLDVITNHIPAGHITAYPTKKRGPFSLRLRGWLPFSKEKKGSNFAEKRFSS